MKAKIKHVIVITLGFILQMSAQPPENSLKQQQYGIRIGLLNIEASGEFRLEKKQSVRVSLGIGGNYNSSDKFIRDYKGLDENRWKFFDNHWLSFYVTGEYRYYIDKTDKEYSNSGFYTGVKAKFNTPNIDDDRWYYRESYKYGGIIGFQTEFGKNDNFLFDTHIGLGAMTNFDFTYTSAQLVFNVFISYSIFQKN